MDRPLHSEPHLVVLQRPLILRQRCVVSVLLVSHRLLVYSSIREISYAMNFRTARMVSHSLVYLHCLHTVIAEIFVRVKLRTLAFAKFRTL